MQASDPIYGEPFPIRYDQAGDRAYVVRRRFDGQLGHKFERDQVVPTWTNEWRVIKVFHNRHILIQSGFLVEMPEGTPVLLCPCPRYWLTRDALTTHGCCEFGELSSERHRPDEAGETVTSKTASGCGICGIRHRGITHPDWELKAARLERVFRDTLSYAKTAQRVKDGPKDWRTVKHWITAYQALRGGA